MNKIEEFLLLASRHYYAGGPIISDVQFDALADSIGFNHVGAKQHENVEKHFQRMYSLQKYYEGDKTKPLAEYHDLCMSPKLDGAAISLLYIDGKLVRGLTRGDGIEGRVITDKALLTKGVPKEIDAKGILQVTGEVCAPKHVENARNYAAGALNLGDAKEYSTRSVEFFAYGVYPYMCNTYDKDMQCLRMFGFQTVQDAELDNVFPTDGVVFRINDNETFENLGFTSKHPKGAYALKERSEAVETKLIGVEWQVGKTGKVTPVALLEPVYIGDALVSRATLNNGAFIAALDLRIGDVVAVRRAGEIIPQIIHKVE